MSSISQKIQFIVVMTGLMIFGSGIATAEDCGHEAAPSANAEQRSMSHSMSMADRPIQTATIPGQKVSLDVMSMDMHVHMQAMKGNPVPDHYDSSQSRAIMVMVQSLKSKEPVTDAGVEIKIISPKGKELKGKALWCGDHYGRSFSPAEKGAYRIIVNVAGKEGKGKATFKYKFEG